MGKIEEKVTNLGRSFKEMSGKEKAFFIFNNIEEAISAVAMSVLLTLTCVNVIGRYIFHYSVPGIDELVTLAFTWAVFPGASACYKRNMHYGIDMLVNALPKTIQRWLMTVIHLFLTISLGYVAYLAIQLTANVGYKVTSYYMFSYRYVDLAAVVGFGFMCIHSLRFFIRDLKHPDDVLEPLIAQEDYTGESTNELESASEGGELD